MRTFVAALFLSLMQALPAQAAAPDHGRIVAAVSSRFLAPRYKALAEAGRDNAAAWKSFCGGTGERSLSDLHSAHRALALAFSTVQAFRFGPVGEGSTAERLYFWPERRNAVAKGLAGLMAGKEPIGARRIAQASAAARGIPALERLAFPDGEALPDTRSCEAGVAVSADLAAGLAAVSTAWNEPGKGIADRMAAGKLDPALAPDMQQAASRLVTDFMTALAPDAGPHPRQPPRPSGVRRGDGGKRRRAASQVMGRSHRPIDVGRGRDPGFPGGRRRSRQASRSRGSSQRPQGGPRHPQGGNASRAGTEDRFQRPRRGLTCCRAGISFEQPRPRPPRWLSALPPRVRSGE
jgi:hypothetical protein